MPPKRSEDRLERLEQLVESYRADNERLQAEVRTCAAVLERYSPGGRPRRPAEEPLTEDNQKLMEHYKDLTAEALRNLINTRYPDIATPHLRAHRADLLRRLRACLQQRQRGGGAAVARLDA